MEKLRLRTGSMELKVKGSAELIRDEREAFYRHINEITEKKAGVLQDVRDSFLQAAESSQIMYDSCKVLNRVCGEIKGTWKEIEEAIKSGAEIKVGDYKKDNLEDSQSFTMVVTDVTNEYVRFESRDCVGEEVEWNEDGSTKVGYPFSDIHKYLNKELFQRLPEELKNVIGLAERKTVQNGEEKSFNALLFLPAASEVFGEDDCYGDEGLYEQLEYYKDRRHRMKGEAEGGDTCVWWLASVRSGGSTYACCVDSHGYASYWNASNAHRVPVCFIIKKS